MIRAFRVSSVCALVLCGVLWGLAAPAAAGQAGVGELPVVLVHGLGGSPWFTWGAPDGAQGLPGELGRWAADKAKALAGPGLFARLSATSPGRVFCFDYPTQAPLGETAQRLGEFIVEVLGETGAPQVDVVTHGSGALVARMCLWERACPLECVRKLVMIAPPNGGSILANLVHADACWGQASAAFRQRAAVYEPLFERFVRERKLGDPAQRRHVSFQTWLRREQPELYASRIVAGQGETPDGILSEAYYELVAMELAVRTYFRQTRDWRAVPLRSWGTGVAAVLEALGRLGILVPDPSGQAVRLLVTEYVPFERERGVYDHLVANRFLHEWKGAEAAEREENQSWPTYCIVAGEVPNVVGLLAPQVGANDLAVEVSCAYLPQRDDDWFVLYRDRAWAVVARTVWKLFGRKIAQSLGYPELGELVKGESLKFVRYSHMGLPREPDVMSWVEKMTSTRFLSREEHRPTLPRTWRFWTAGMTGGGLATRWEPYYVLFDATRLRGVSGTLYISLSADAARGRGYTPDDRHRFWVYAQTATDGSLHRWEIPGEEDAPGRASLALEGFGAEYARVYLAARVAATGPFDPGLYGAKAGLGYTYAARFFPLPEGEEEDAVAAAGKVLERAGFEQIEAPSPPTGGERPTPKLLRVTRPGQKLTEMKERTERHVRWEWEFSGGEPVTDTDPGHTTVTLQREFWTPGLHRVSASSYSDAGRLLRQLRWDVEVPDDARFPFVVAFTAETAIPPDVRIAIEGPGHWVTGRVAEYVVHVHIVEPPFGQSEVTVIRPARMFAVVWDKPGTYEVRAVAAVKTTYRFPEGTVSVRNVFAAVKSVEVCTTVVTQ